MTSSTMAECCKGEGAGRCACRGSRPTTPLLDERVGKETLPLHSLRDGDATAGVAEGQGRRAQERHDRFHHVTILVRSGFNI